MADYFPLLSRTIASLGNSTPEQRQIVYDRARSVVSDQLTAIEPPMDSDAIKRELSLFEAAVMRLEHDMQSLEAIKPQKLPGETETRKHISARLSALLAKAAADRAATTQNLLRRDIEPADPSATDGDATPGSGQQSHVTPRVTVERVPEPVIRATPRPSAPMAPQVVERKRAMPSIADAPKPDAPKPDAPIPDPSIPDPSIAESPLPDSPPPVLPEPVITSDPPEAVSDPVSGADQGASAQEGNAHETPRPDADPSALLDGAAGTLEVEADQQLADKVDGAAPVSVTEDPVVPPTAVQSAGDSLSRLLNKAQDFWQKKSPLPGPATPAAAPELPADRPEDEQPSLFADSHVLLPNPAADEATQPALSADATDDHFVGPLLPAAEVHEYQEGDNTAAPEVVASDIVFSDDAAPAADDAQGELPLLVPPKPVPASEIELLDDGRPRLAQRRKRDRSLFRGLVMGLAFVSVIAAVAGAAWVLRDRPADFEQGSTPTRGDFSRKISDRLPSEAVVASSQPGGPVVEGGGAVAVAGQRVMLFEESVEGQPAPAPIAGRVTWVLETIRDQTGAGDVAIKADIKGLTGSLSAATMMIKRNRETGYMIELTFMTPDDGPNGRVRDIGIPEMRAEEGMRGTSLMGLPIPVTDNAFLVGLNNLPDKVEQNRDLLRTRNWIVIPMRFATGRRAWMMVEKGLVGDRVLLDAFQVWK